MLGRFTGIFAGYEKRMGKNGEYYIVRFLDERGKVFECIAREDFDTIICLGRLEEVDFFADVEVKGPYIKISFRGLV